MFSDTLQNLLRPSSATSRGARRPLPGRPHPPLHPSLAFIHDRSLRYLI